MKGRCGVCAAGAQIIRYTPALRRAHARFVDGRALRSVPVKGEVPLEAWMVPR